MHEEESYSKENSFQENKIYSGLELLKLEKFSSGKLSVKEKHPGYLINNLLASSVVFLAVDSTSPYQNLLIENS